jgi:hypothetical protein
MRIPLGNPSTSADDEGDLGSGMTEHFNQAVNTESVDLATNKIADPGLRDAHQLGRGSLSQASCFDKPSQLNHQVGANPKVLGLFSAESKILEDIARGFSNSSSHLSLLLAASAQGPDLSQPVSRERQINFAGLPTPFFKSVQDVHRLFEFRQIDDSMLGSSVNPNLKHANSDRRQRLMVTRHQAGLNPSQLITRSTAGIRRKGSNDLKRRCDPNERFVSHGVEYTRIYIFCQGLPNKRIQPTISAVMPAAGHPACQPRRS